MVGFEPTNTGATTQGLNHLTTPTIYLVITRNTLSPLRLVLSHIHEYVPSVSLEVSRLTSNSRRILNTYARNTLSTSRVIRGLVNGDRERARTVDLQRDRLAF